jgi:type III pantothenate kinase
MFLAIDIGNTNITFGLFDIKDGKANSSALKVWRMSTDKNKTSDEYGTSLINMFFYSRFDSRKVFAVAAASVAPYLNFVFEEMILKYFNKKIFFINYKSSCKLSFASRNPSEIGADRIANSVAAFSIFGGGCVVVDFGTAATFDCIDLKGKYLGGAIAPGPVLSANSLSMKTAQLPQIEMKKPKQAIGSNTVECMQSGIYFGYAGLIKELLVRIKKEMRVKKIIATGGLADLMSAEIKEINCILPDLTLNGIYLIWKQNKRG